MCQEVHFGDPLANDVTSYVHLTRGPISVMVTYLLILPDGRTDERTDGRTDERTDNERTVGPLGSGERNKRFAQKSKFHQNTSFLSVSQQNKYFLKI